MALPDDNRDRFLRGEVRVVAQIGDVERTLGLRTWVYTPDESPEQYALRFRDAWDSARAQAEDTLRHYGAEGLARAIAESEGPDPE